MRRFDIVSQLVCLDIESALQAALQQVQSLLLLAHCLAASKSRRQLNETALVIISFKSSICFPLISGARADNPVMFPPGRARLATNPLPIGSLSCAMIIGVVAVACLAGPVAAGPAVTSASSRRWTSSDAITGKRSDLPFCGSPFNDDVLAFDIAELAEPLPKGIGMDRGPSWRKGSS